MSKYIKHQHSYVLTAGESDAEGQMPVSLLTTRVIEVATEHANMLNIGYDTLITKNVGWVLSRLSMEIYRYPEINEHYTLTTWIESYNRHFSERNFALTDGKGEPIGYMRTVWVPMDFETRTKADLSVFGADAFPTADLACPMAKAPRIGALPEGADEMEYTFRYCDIDFNRHVNTVRYIELMLNYWPLGHYDKKMLSRIDVLFHHECHYGETVRLRISADKTAPVERNLCEILRPGGEKAISAAFEWKDL